MTTRPTRRTPTDALALLHAAPIVPVHADEDGDRAFRLAAACAAGGVRAYEATDRMPGSFDAFVRLRTRVDREAPELMLGVGSVEDVRDAERYALAGAEFVVTPFVDVDLLRWCRDAGVLAVPGAMTPTEVRTARREGVALVKLFPAATLGPDHLRHLRGPDRTTRFMPTGGLRADAATLRGWAEAGATCLGLGGGLLAGGADDPEAATALERRCRDALAEVIAARPADVAAPPAAAR